MAKHGKRMHGRILAVWEEKRGTELTDDAAAGTKVLYVDDVSPFNDDDEEPGGWLMVGDQVVEYTTVDDDASTITLATALTATVTASGDEPEVWVWNDLYDEVDTVQWAQVMPDGKRDQGDAIEAVVSDSIDGLPNGDRGRPREGCLIERDGDEWELVKVKGRPSKARGLRAEADDSYVLTAADIAAGVATMPLSHRPADEWLVAFWNGIGQAPTEYTVNYDAQTVTWPLSGFEQAGDRFHFHYEYLTGINTPRVVSSASVAAVNSGGGVLGEEFAAPAAAAAGDTVIFSILVPDGETVTGHGYSLVTETTVVQHAGQTYGPFDTQWRYKLQVWAGVKGAAVPTISGNAGGNPWVSVAYPAGSSVAGSAVATVADGTSAPAPALTDGSLRIWGNVGNVAFITAPGTSTVHVNFTGGDLMLCVATDATAGPLVASSAPTSAGWMTATLSVTS